VGAALERMGDGADIVRARAPHARRTLATLATRRHRNAHSLTRSLARCAPSLARARWCAAGSPCPRRST
jgi:hypothetical protein